MIIHRAFIREVLRTGAAVTAILFSIFLVTRLMGFLSDAAEGDIPLDGVFLLLLLKMMTYLDVIMALVLYIAVLLVTGRWIRDNEMTVLSACGIGMSGFIRPALILVAVVGGMVAAFSLYLTPLSAEAFQSIRAEHRNRSDVTGITPGVFTTIRNAEGVYFVEGYDPASDTFRDIFIYNRGRGHDQVVVAARGERTTDTDGGDLLALGDGAQYRVNAGAGDYSVVEFEGYALRLDPRPAGAAGLPVKAMPTATLLGDARPLVAAELHWRLSKVIMLPVLMLLALSFSSIRYRGARFPGMFAALVVYFTYSNLLGLAAALARRGAADPGLALWAVHATFLALALYLFHRRGRNLRLLPGLTA